MDTNTFLVYSAIKYEPVSSFFLSLNERKILINKYPQTKSTAKTRHANK